MQSNSVSPCLNFRDFGGLSSRHGGRVLLDRLYRCGKPASSQPYLPFDFSQIADLRHPAERLETAPIWPADWANRIVMVQGPNHGTAPHLSIISSPELNERIIDGFYVNLYSTFIFEPNYQSVFARFIRGLATTQGRALIYCAAGKDRTGLLAALILTLLEVAQDDVTAEYMRSSRDPGLTAMVPIVISNIEQATGRRHSEQLALRMLDVREEYLESMFEALRQNCGTAERYFEKIGVSKSEQNAVRSRLIA